MFGVYPKVEQLSSLNISKGCQCPISAYIFRYYPKGRTEHLVIYFGKFVNLTVSTEQNIYFGKFVISDC